MRNGINTPSISVEIGGQRRIYHAFVTTAKPALDGPSTLTLYASDFADVAAFAATPIPFSRELGAKPARVVLVNSTELEWHRATYRSERCLFAPADSQLIGLQALQRWLWQRLSAPVATATKTA
jgi:hypothetical protein